MAFQTRILEQLREQFYGGDGRRAAVITQRYGPTTVDLEPAYNGYAHFHKGIDLVLDGGQNAPIRSPVSGRVVYAGYMQRGQPGSEGYGSLGNAVVVQTATGYKLAFGHMSNFQ